MISLCADTLCRHFWGARNHLNITVNQQGSKNNRSASFVIGRRGQLRGGAIVGEGPFEFYPSDEVQHVSSSVLGQLLRVLVLDGGRRSLGLVVSAVAQTGGLSLGGGGGLMLLLLLLLEEQLLLLQVVLLLIQILLMLQLLRLLKR